MLFMSNGRILAKIPDGTITKHASKISGGDRHNYQDQVREGILSPRRAGIMLLSMDRFVA